MRKEEIQCKELNEEQKCILKTYRVRTAKKQINRALHFIVEHKCSIPFSELLISIFHYFSSAVSGSYASVPIATPLISLKSSSHIRAPHTRSLGKADLPSCKISTLLELMGQDKNFSLLIQFEECLPHSYVGRNDFLPTNDKVTFPRCFDVRVHLIKFRSFERGCSQSLLSCGFGVIATTSTLPFGPQTSQVPGFCIERSSMLIKALMAITPYPWKTAFLTLFA